jgi:DNA-binding CsgD family transcriptional regulator
LAGFEPSARDPQPAASDDRAGNGAWASIRERYFYLQADPLLLLLRTCFVLSIVHYFYPHRSGSARKEELAAMGTKKSAMTKRPKKRKPQAALPVMRKRPESLTGREHEILQLIWTGLKNKEIGQRLKISVKTVEAHRANMMKKVRVSNTAQLLKAAIQGGMIKLR